MITAGQEGIEGDRRPSRTSRRSSTRPSRRPGIAFLIVCDMLLTGFDAPIEQVMYIDKRVQEHNLLQTIARVNRVAKGKNRGYIVDYIGLASHLKEALSIYADEDDREDIRESLKDITERDPDPGEPLPPPPATFIDQGVARDRGVRPAGDHGPEADDEILERAVELLEDIKLRADFEVYLKKFFQSMDVILPERCGHALQDPRPAIRLPPRPGPGALQGRVARHLGRRGEGAEADQRAPRRPRDQPEDPACRVALARCSSRRSNGTQSPKAKASEMEHAIRKHLKVHFEEDPALYRKLSEKLEALIQQHKEEWDQLFLGLVRAAAGGRGRSPGGRLRASRPKKPRSTT